MSEETLNGADLVIKSLVDQDVDVIFGYPGGAVLPIYDSLFKQNSLRHILVRHEQAAVHAAEGYARSTGKVGVVLVTSGPGATNAVTGLTDALMDSIPIVCLTGQVATHLIGNDAFQEADTTGITRPCTKHNYLVKNVADLPRIMHEAFYVAKTGRPGPVVIDLPKDILMTPGVYNAGPKSQHKSYKPQVKGDLKKIEQAVELMTKAKRPIFYTGGGVINSGPKAAQLLQQLVKLSGFPITNTLMGLGAYQASDTFYASWSGTSGPGGGGPTPGGTGDGQAALPLTPGGPHRPSSGGQFDNGPSAGRTGDGEPALPLTPGGPHRPTARDFLPELAGKQPNGPSPSGGLGGFAGRLVGAEEPVPESDPATPAPSAGPGAQLAEALRRQASIERLGGRGYNGGGPGGGPGGGGGGGSVMLSRPSSGAFSGPRPPEPVRFDDVFFGAAGARRGATDALTVNGDAGGTASWGTDAANPETLAGVQGPQILLPKRGEVDSANLLRNLKATLPGTNPQIDLPTINLLLTTADGGDARLRTSLIQGGLLSPQPASNGYRVLTLPNGTVFAPQVLPSGEIRIREYVRQSESNTASYSHIEDNPFTKVADAPLSTFGADVDTASWSNIRRILRAGQLPPAGAVRIEEMVNYFPYRYAAPNAAPDDVGAAFAAHVDVAGCPWETSHRLVRIGIKGRDVEKKERPAANLVFLLDVSGSMQPENRLPLVLRSMKLLTEQLEARDKVSIVVYAGNSGLVLPPTTGDRKADILAALERLQAGGSTNGGQGIELAYKTATEAFIPGGINRVILATDGDFNVGVTDNSSLVRLIEEKAKAKVFLSVLGVGDDNLKDDRMEQLADKGNGNYAYLDSDREAKKVLVDQMQGTLQTIAKDLKLQVEFNPLRVASWRLIGYENRVMAAQDFADDKKDAGDVGAGHTVTALYEIVPANATLTAASEGLRYQQGPQPSPAANSGELLTVKIRWKLPEGDVSTLREQPVMDATTSYAQAPSDFKFAAAVAAFGMILRDSPHKGNATLSAVEELAGEGLDFDPDGHRREFLELVRIAKGLKK